MVFHCEENRKLGESMTEAPVYNMLITMFPSMVGAFVSLRFLPKGVGKLNKLSSFTSSMFVGHYIGRGIAELYGFIGVIESAIILTTGMVGLTVVSHVLSEVPKTFEAARRKYFDSDN